MHYYLDDGAPSIGRSQFTENHVVPEDTGRFQSEREPSIQKNKDRPSFPSTLTLVNKIFRQPPPQDAEDDTDALHPTPAS
ncbi:hypothetical protein BIW11_09687 [Tropilaelaps mercedesae]|uniref:Uncharacterized protein n=1 Tax=Tropilaelaps mercedesae TaxID=418985 RepID=A0A1V9XJH5_9ACAR|nr:hypothetical protein BIW11_09687 [Tropilaelaps mercedesae]